MQTPPNGIRARLPLFAGIGLGVLWVAMAAGAIASAVGGGRMGRSDWALGWGLVGGFLLVAGCAAIIGTWWHVTRVARR